MDRSTPQAPSGRVLVVDDDPGTRGVFRAVLEVAGYTTLGAEGIQAAHAELMDATTELVCVLLDEGLPDGRGLDLLRLIRKTPETEDLPVLVITGHDQPEDEIASLGSGATDFLVKPVDGAVLLARVGARIRERVATGTYGSRSPPGTANPAARARCHEEIAEVIQQSAFTPVYQPIVDLETGGEVGLEALTRFADGFRPDHRFHAAAEIGLGLQLELATLEAAVAGASALTEGRFLSLNVTPTLLSHRVHDLQVQLARADGNVVVEITEKEAIEDYGLVRSSLATLDPGVRLSIDDAGAGFASLRHVLMLEPDFVKLDRWWVSGIEARPSVQAMVAGLVHFARTTGCRLVAEGIETEAEHRVMVDLGVDLGQGYRFGRPVPLVA